jgi:hypothetical protein
MKKTIALNEKNSPNRMFFKSRPLKYFFNVQLEFKEGFAGLTRSGVLQLT